MDYLTQFKIDDLSNDNSEFTFILESPHRQEVNDGFPAAGATGTWMSRAMFKLDTPLGELVRTKSNHIPRLSLLNCSRLPLQISCYNRLELTPEYSDFLNIQTTHDDNIQIAKQKIKNKLRSKIGEQALTSFRSRLLKNITNCSQLKIIVCGVIAQCFFEEVTQLKVSLRKPTQVNWQDHSFSVFYEYHPSPSSGVWQNSSNMVKLLKFMS
ncbi:hypothetical protein [Paraglaciecola sp. 20A4]|uniref:hypothetical protein n=1 Tax=Paraglaciecola sp. 20A4 TaxID=2687288 RepID=UPI00140E8684|nr:hypothetical protein [Paraglaciecola sp. 20A4]